MTGALDPARRAALTAGETGYRTPAEPAAGLRPMYLVDGPLGLVSPTFDERETSLLLPSGIALGATWDPDVVRSVAAAEGAEARRRGFDAVYAPNLNLARTGLSGRTFEMLSEDPLLAGVLGAAFVEGLQGQGVAAVPKHLVCNDTETERQRMSADVDDTALREVYLRPFELAVRAGAWALMTAYNRLNGTPCAAHTELLAIVKGEWGFDGLVISDYFALHETLGPALAGLDLEMPGPAIHFGARLAEAVERGEVPQARVDDAVTRLLRLAGRVGALEGSERQVSAPAVPAGRAHEVLVEAAVAAFVLCRNEDVLPLDPAVRRLAVIGPNADRPCFQGATFGRIRPGGGVTTPVEAVRKRFPGEVVHERGVDGVPPAPLGGFAVSTPDGRPGVLLEHFRGGELVLSEVRADSTFIWFGDVPGAGPTTEPGTLRLTAVFTPPVEGRWTFGAGGSGATTLSVGGTVLASQPAPAPGDVMGQVARAETTGAGIELRAGEPVTVVAEMVSAGSRVQALTVSCTPPSAPGALERARRLAAEADAVVLVVGDELETSRESRDLASSALPAAHRELIREVGRVNPRTVVVVNAGRPVDAPWAGDVGAVLQGWFAGQGFGEALARVLAGDDEPGGRMPVTVPLRDEDRSTHGEVLDADLRRDYTAAEPTGYRHLARSGTRARFAFGSGLGYTTFRFGPAAVDRAGVRVPVTNTGPRRGREVVQVYVRAPGEEDARLAGFTGVRLDPDETAEVTVPLDERTWHRWREGRWVVPPGVHEVLVARSAEEITQVLHREW
ncbi:glycoside hydrolase family 3 C-terminal domain-containing protein [Amycolatopsis thermalba]|uniref:Glycoside hydrolase family 3 C-terminal domain-containing protein n=1 Tax=Amycolatopsis thermalba TaxID=944492 RepID=A0ABY4NV13_9PSEU|nr:glycoside hydrolase family 3 C-terminal domain-containing protein [Amycolatopsis thermalba]UQS23920.1 glycoside hydrolase family 3 C-terminal domain-containing protein [Amycolatopsis thermalba]